MIPEASRVDIRYQWYIGEVCFSCLCGEKDHVMSKGGDESTCDCGREYKLIHRISITKDIEGASQ